MASGSTAAPIIKAYGTVKNPPHGWGTLKPPEAKAEGVVTPPEEDRDAVRSPRSQ